ncbi:MAG: hypothetical protein JNL74_13630 [Fibrobacteres bacterium]|nr:hypothetical protein [Fibrobacterota bacterium]
MSKASLRLLLIASVFLVIGGAAGFYFYQKNKEYRAIPVINYNSDKIVRIHEFQRVQRIVKDEANHKRIYLGCQEGLLRFNSDEGEWQTIRLDHGLPNESVRAFAFVNKRLVVGTERGIAMVNESADSCKIIESSKDFEVLGLVNLNDSVVYGIAMGRAPFKITRKENSIVEDVVIPEMGADSFWNCVYAHAGVLYFGREGRNVVSWNPESGKVKEYSLKHRIGKRTQFNELFVHNGRLIAATSDEGVWSGELSSDTLTVDKDFPCRGAFVFSPEKDGYWCGTPWGLWRYYDASGAWIQMVHPEENEAGQFQVTALLPHEGLLWYGSRDLGGGYFNTVYAKWTPLYTGLSAPNIAAVVCFDSLVLVSHGYQGKFVDQYSRKTLQSTFEFRPSQFMTDPNIQSMASDDERVYFGGFEGFTVWNRKKNSFREWERGTAIPSADISCIVVRSKESVLLGSVTGVVEHQPDDEAFRIIEPTKQYRITSMYVAEDTLYFGTLSHGAFKLDLKSGNCFSLPFDFSSRVIAVYPVSFDGVSAVVSASTKEGIKVLLKDKQKSITLNVPDSMLMQDFDYKNELMVSHYSDGYILFGTRDNGCLILNPSSKSFSKLGYYEGLLSDQIRSFCSDSQFVYVGTYGGFNRVDKRMIK